MSRKFRFDAEVEMEAASAYAERAEPDAPWYDRVADTLQARLWPLPDRSGERGLHQMIEAKEGCQLSARRETLARITYQRLFRRYVRLASMTGTAREVAGDYASLN